MEVMHGPVPLLHDYIIHSAREFPDKTALVCMRQRISYRELNARSNAIAHALTSSGVQRGDRVFIFADNTVETVISFWAVLKANAVVSIVNPMTKAEKLNYLLGDSRPTALITDQHLYSVFADPARACTHLRRVIVSGLISNGDLSAIPNALGWDDALASGNQSEPPRRL